MNKKKSKYSNSDIINRIVSLKKFFDDNINDDENPFSSFAKEYGSMVNDFLDNASSDDKLSKDIENMNRIILYDSSLDKDTIINEEDVTRKEGLSYDEINSLISDMINKEFFDAEDNDVQYKYFDNMLSDVLLRKVDTNKNGTKSFGQYTKTHRIVFEPREYKGENIGGFSATIEIKTNGSVNNGDDKNNVDSEDLTSETTVYVNEDEFKPNVELENTLSKLRTYYSQLNE